MGARRIFNGLLTELRNCGIFDGEVAEVAEDSGNQRKTVDLIAKKDCMTAGV